MPLGFGLVSLGFGLLSLGFGLVILILWLLFLCLCLESLCLCLVLLILNSSFVVNGLLCSRHKWRLYGVRSLGNCREWRIYTVGMS